MRENYIWEHGEKLTFPLEKMGFELDIKMTRKGNKRTETHVEIFP
jgi:hypothetical protein